MQSSRARSELGAPDRRPRLLGRGMTSFGVAMLCVLGFAMYASPARATTTYADALTRAPYLTDLVGTHVAVNFNTDKSGSAASVQWGAVNNGTCALTSTVTAARVGVTVGSTAEYQWY